MASLDTEREIKDLKRRLDLAETRLSQLEGRFEFISGQLRDIQLYMHARFSDLEQKLDSHDKRFDEIEAKIDAIPRAVAELIAGRDRR